MARPLRIEYDGGLYHITSRGNERKAIFKDAGDRQLFLRILAQLTEHCHWICHAYCLMNNHYHLVIETPDGNLSKGMRRLNGVYTQAFNRRHHRVGHLFQGRFKAILVQKESHYLAGYRLHACRARRLFRKPPLTAARRVRMRNMPSVTAQSGPEGPFVKLDNPYIESAWSVAYALASKNCADQHADSADGQQNNRSDHIQSSTQNCCASS